MAGQIQRAAEQRAAEKDESEVAQLTLRQAVRASESAFKMALPEHIKVDRFIRAAFTAINVVPRLGECTQDSVLAGLMQAAQLGLEVSDVRGQCFLIPRQDNRAGGVMKASFQLGYRGMIDLAARSGITVDAEELHANDQFDFSLGTNRFLHHRPTFDDRGPVLAYYATATFADKRTPAFAVMSLLEVEEHRDKFASTRDSRSKEIKGPWVDHFDAMARKTVIRALLNYLPVAVELREAMHAEAIDVESREVPPAIDYGTRLQIAEAPEGVDAATGEIDPTTAVEAAGDVECTGAADCPATTHVEGCFAVSDLPPADAVPTTPDPSKPDPSPGPATTEAKPAAATKSA